MSTTAASPIAPEPAPPRAARTLSAALILVLSWTPALAGLLLCLRSTTGIEAVGTLSGALAFGGAAALLPTRGGHGGRGGPLLPIALAVSAVGAGASTLASGLRSAGIGDGPWLDALGVAWMPGGLTVAGVLGAAVMLRSRSLLAAGALLSTAIAATSAAELQQGRQLPVAAALWVVWLALALGSGLMILWAAARRSSPDREAALWLAVSHFALLLSGVGGYLVGDEGGTSFVGTAFAAAFLPAGVLFAAASFVLTAIARAPEAVDPPRARVAVGVLLISALLIAYGAVAATVAALAPITPTSGGMIAVVLLAVGAEPARRGIQRAVDQLLYGRSADPRTLLRTVSEEIAGGQGGSLGALAAALRQSLRLGGVAISSSSGEGARAEAGSIDPSTRQIITLFAADGPCGTVEVCGTPGRRAEPRSIDALRRIGGVLSVAVLLADVNEGLREARDRARLIAGSERRFARAEIEAGIEPALARIRRDLDELPEADDPAAVLGRATTALQSATTDVRDLARTLLPGSLDAGDLPGALAELAARFEHPALLSDVRRAPEHPEAVYHLVAEAVLRARRRGGIERIEIAVRSIDRWDLRMRGDEADTRPVLAALRARAAEAGYRTQDGPADTLTVVGQV
ncbi:sensor histidine kinase [Microbacterium saperdae]